MKQSKQFRLKVVKVLKSRRIPSKKFENRCEEVTKEDQSVKVNGRRMTTVHLNIETKSKQVI